MLHFLHHINELHLEVTPLCNLRCRYCFVGDLPIRRQQSRFMPTAIALNAIERICHYTSSTSVLVTFHGGESTLQRSGWFDEICTESLAVGKRKGKSIQFSLQSNGSRLSPSLLAVFAKHRIRLGISLDGPKEIHDAARGGFDATIAAIRALRDANLLGGTITVITAFNHKAIPRFLEFLEAEGLRHASFNEYYVHGRGAREHAISAEDLFIAWNAILDFMLTRKGVGPCDRNMLDRVRRFVHPLSLEELRSQLSCARPFCHAGIRMIHVSTNGDVFPCGTSAWIAPPRFLLGNIRSLGSGESWMNTLQSLHARDTLYRRSCPHCPAAQICSFGCSAFEKTDPRGKKTMCDATQMLWHRFEELGRDRLRSLVASTADMRVAG